MDLTKNPYLPVYKTTLNFGPFFFSTFNMAKKHHSSKKSQKHPSLKKADRKIESSSSTEDPQSSSSNSATSSSLPESTSSSSQVKEKKHERSIERTQERRVLQKPASQNRVQKKSPDVLRHTYIDDYRWLNSSNPISRMKAPIVNVPRDMTTQTEYGNTQYYKRTDYFLAAGWSIFHPTLPTIREEEETESADSNNSFQPTNRSRYDKHFTIDTLADFHRRASRPFPAPTRRSERLKEKRMRQRIQELLEYYAKIWSTEEFDW